MTVYAKTYFEPSYPRYVSVNDRGGLCEVTVRSPAAADGKCGSTSAATLEPADALDMARAIIAKYS